MENDGLVIASGNLATARRTITGVLGQFMLLNVSDRTALDIFTDAGLPARALEELDFPISLDQELLICLGLANHLGERSPARVFFGLAENMGIENLGVLGMAMLHAATTIEALKVCLTYPQLTWGHCRMVVRRQPESSVFSFAMHRPKIRDASTQDLDRLVEYCTVLDLLTSMRNIEDIVASGQPPLYITFPFPEPADWAEICDELPCPVYFSSEEACLAFPAAFDDTPLPRANPLMYRSYVSMAKNLSLMLAEDIGISERVTRWLWACAPPLRRGDIAKQLGMSERSLTRALAAENTSYAELLALVQQERAENFLRNRSLAVTEISERLGYSEPAAFTRAFSNWTGSSPLKWRKENLG